MNRFMILATAVLVVVAGMTVTQEAEAGLFNRNKNKCCEAPKCSKPKKCRRQKRKAKKCCEQTCCAPAPTCCEAAPVCAAPAPCAPACAAPAPCGCAAAPAPSCGGCEVASCGCDAAPACGCETTNCNCLSKRKLRRANRKGECCGAKANSCNTCSAPVTTCGYEVAAPAGCSSCGSAAPVAVEGCSSCSGETVIESAPAPAAEEAAPEAPESTT